MALTPNVVDGQIIMASWGNTVRDRTVQRFASIGERDSQWPAATAGQGARCITVDSMTTWESSGAAWVPVGNGIFLAYKQATGNITIAGAPTDLTGLTVTLTTIGGRLYRISGKAAYQTTSGTPNVLTRIYEDATAIADEAQVFLAAANTPYQGLVTAYRRPAAGSHTWKMTANTGGTGVQFVQNLSTQCFITVEDMGSFV